MAAPQRTLVDADFHESLIRQLAGQRDSLVRLMCIPLETLRGARGSGQICLKLNLARLAWQHYVCGMSFGLPPKNWPFPLPPTRTSTASTLLGSAPIDYSAGLSPFVSPPPQPDPNALSAFVGVPPTPGTTLLGAAPPYTNALAALMGDPLAPGTSMLLGAAPPHANALAALMGDPLAPGASTLLGGVFEPPHWRYVRRRFNAFLANLAITPAQREDGETKQAGVRACLNRRYWGISSETANSLLIGSWGKGTQVRPPRDVDILFLLPSDVYHRFQQRDGNRQSKLLQEVKDVLAATFSQTTMRGDGQVIVIPFSSTPIELSPGFRCGDGSIIVCDTNEGGRYTTSTAEFEERELSASDARWNGNSRGLARMLKHWQREHNAPLESFIIERLAVHFLATWAFSHQDVFYYDWMIRDFFAWLLNYVNGSLTMPATSEVIPLGNDWQFRAERAHKNAVRACENEYGNYGALAGEDWQRIFGTNVPILVS
jgi:hypothetical protein